MSKWGQHGFSSSDTTSDGALDVHGRPAVKTRTGGWRACFFIYFFEVAERMAYYGISANLVTYLTEELHESLSVSSQNVSNWNGAVYLCPFLGALVADAYLGRHITTCLFLLVYLAGFILLTLTVSLEVLKPPSCTRLAASQGECAKASTLQLGMFYLALYVVALGAGGVKPNISSFGADQFDEGDEREARRKKSFFNWWYTGIGCGILFSVTVIVYLQDNVSWGWGLGVPLAILALAMAVYLAGSSRYRYQPPTGSPLTQVAQVLAASLSKWRTVSTKPLLFHELPHRKYSTPGRRQMLRTASLPFLDRAAAIAAPATAASGTDTGTTTAIPSPSPWKLCTVTEVEEVKLVLGLLPVWLTQLLFQAVIGQALTLFTKQASSMDRSLGPGGFTLPPASCGTFAALAILTACPLYDRLLVPMVRRVTGNPRGLTHLQRMGVGILLSIVCIMCAAAVERRRRHDPSITVFWLVPQYALVGIADAFGVVAEMEFFYDQAPDHMRSLGSALYLSTTGVGSFLSSGLISVTNRVTGRAGRQRWIGTRVQDSRLDKFYWLLAALSAVNLAFFLVAAWCYQYKKTERCENDDDEIAKNEDVYIV